MERLYGFDALRGIAAFIVVFYHLPAVYGGPLFGNGLIAVDFFFMLSGFVLERSFRDDKGLFLLRRIRRLWPTMAFGALLYLVAMPERPTMTIIVANILIIPASAGAATFALNGPAWSVFLELGVNFLHPFFRNRPHLLLVAILASGATFLIAAIHLNTMDFGPWKGTNYLGIPRAIFSYFIGVMIFRHVGDRVRLKIHPTLVVCLLPIFWLMPVSLSVQLLAVLCLSPVLIFGGLAWNAGRIGGWLGRLSFPLYATHAGSLLVAARIGLHPLAAVLMAILVAAVWIWLSEILPRQMRRNLPSDEQLSRRISG